MKEGRTRDRTGGGRTWRAGGGYKYIARLEHFYNLLTKCCNLPYKVVLSYLISGAKRSAVSKSLTSVTVFD